MTKKCSINTVDLLALCTMIGASTMGSFAAAADLPLKLQGLSDDSPLKLQGLRDEAEAWRVSREDLSWDPVPRLPTESAQECTEVGARSPQSGATAGHNVLSAEREPEAETLEHDDSAVDGTLLFSFMVLRALIAVRSVNGDSQALMWLGVAFASVSRTIYEGHSLLSSPAPMILSSLKEFSHVYGLCYVLRSFPVESTMQ